MDLFDMLASQAKENHTPLAERMKPRTLEEFYGQEKLIGEGKLLNKLIATDRLSSVIFYGPPGSGKTSLAKIIAERTKSNFEKINAVTAGIKDIRDVVGIAKDTLAMRQTKTVLFIDEIHRFNKTQQDALLPYVEDGTLVLIGATTENPYFEVNGALLSRSMIFRLEPLSQDNIVAILKRALSDDVKGLAAYKVTADMDVLQYIASIANGDARRALNVLEWCMLAQMDTQGEIVITVEAVQASVQMRHSAYDKSGDNHYDIVSAFIKSMRGSDPDAALYYLGKMIYGGEDPRFIARRIVICASEDVGNADPMALVVANNAAQAVHFVGMPEGRIILAQAAVYVASAPKSNASYLGINKVLDMIEKGETGQIPYFLKDGTSLQLERKYTQASHEKYRYPHDYDKHYVEQQYLPDAIKDEVFYRPSDLGHERVIKAHLKWLKE